MDQRTMLLLGLSIVGLIGSGLSSPLESKYSGVLEDFDRQSLSLDDFKSDAVVSKIRSNVKDSFNIDLQNIPDSESIVPFSEIQKEIQSGLEDIDVLLNELETNSEYMLQRQVDPTSLSSVSLKLGSIPATAQDQLVFREDVKHVVSTVVILQMMEDRVSQVNKAVSRKLIENSNQFGGTDAIRAAESLLGLKYLEGFLHAINEMISEALENASGEIPSSLISPTSIQPVTPNPFEDDAELSLGAAILLFFGAIGFVYSVIFLVSLLMKALKLAKDMTERTQKKSKYEQI